MNKSSDNAKAKEKGFVGILYDFFRSLKLTIFLLILLAILSIIGTLITQNATSDEYIQRYGSSLYEVLDFFGLFDMYHSWWFSAILLLLVVNLIACSTERFPGVWNQMLRGVGPEGLSDSLLKTLPFVEKVKLPAHGAGLSGNVDMITGSASLPAYKAGHAADLPVKGTGAKKDLTEENIRSPLSRGFRPWKRVETESAVTLFSERGGFSRLGVYLTHLSILIILVGGLIGSRYGVHGVVNLLEGESVDRIFLRGKDAEIPKSIGFWVRCDDFTMTYYDVPGKERHVKEYASLLTISEDGKEVLKQTVRVNHPLHYRGWAFYQSSYGALQEIAIGVEWKSNREKAVLMALEGDTVPIPNSNATIRVLKYTPQVHAFGEGVQVAVFRPNQQPKGLWLFRGVSGRDQQKAEDFTMSFEGLATREYTGLQVTKDPGVWIVWLGSALLILGLIVSFFFSHQRVWVRISKGEGKTPGEIILAGTASKNRLAFEKTFQQWVDQLRSGS
jgi:cytochrome c biogenesis protein